MLVDLMYTITSDGFRLDGAFFPPAPEATRAGPVDAVLLMHGSHGNFYTATNTIMAQTLSSQGYACLCLNTVAHDNVWASGGNYYGNAYDILDRCRLDIRAGVDYLWELGYRSIGILGFSMGAVRVAYYAAAEDDPRVTTVMPVSPVRLSYSYYMESPDAEEFHGIIQWGRPDGGRRPGHGRDGGQLPHTPAIQRRLLPGQARPRRALQPDNPGPQD